MQKRVLIYGTLAFISIIAIGLKINHIKKDLKKVNETPCEFEPGHQLNLNDLANQLNFGGCRTKWVAIHLSNQSTAIKIRVLQ